MRFPAILAVLVLVSSVSSQAANPPTPSKPANGANFLSHRALYTLRFNPKASAAAKSGGAEITGASGTMGYEVADSCDGWAVRQRLQMTLTNTEGQDIRMTSEYATWEAKSGLKFRFHMKQTTDNTVGSLLDGDAVLKSVGGPGEAHYIRPQETTKPLPAGTMFPTAHTIAIVAAAREGKKFMALPLFDGTEENGVQDSSIAILDWKPPFKTAFPDLSPLPSTRVRLAFFDHSAAATTPTYQQGLRYWENGVADDMQMDFGDFVMDGKLTELTALPKRC